MHNTSGSTPQPDAPSRHIQTPDDEIDLIEVARSLWASRTLIVAITVVVTLLAGIYAFTATPVYQVKSVLRTPQLSSLGQLNATELYSLAPMDALHRVGAELESYDTRWTFYRDNLELFAGMHGEGVPLEQSFEDFNEEAFKVIWPPQSRGGNPPNSHMAIQLEYPEGADGPAIVNGLVAYAIQRETQRVRNDFASVLDSRISGLQQQIKAITETIESSQELPLAPPQGHDIVITDTDPRITELTKELELVSAMKARELAGSFAQYLAKSRGEVTTLESLRLGQDELQLVRIDQPAQQPLNPIKPRKALILAIGLVLGGMLGVMIALLRMAFSNSSRTR